MALTLRPSLMFTSVVRGGGGFAFAAYSSSLESNYTTVRFFCTRVSAKKHCTTYNFVVFVFTANKFTIFLYSHLPQKELHNGTFFFVLVFNTNNSTIVPSHNFCTRVYCKKKIHNGTIFLYSCLTPTTPQLYPPTIFVLAFTAKKNTQWYDFFVLVFNTNNSTIAQFFYSRLLQKKKIPRNYNETKIHGHYPLLILSACWGAPCRQELCFRLAQIWGPRRQG